MPMHSEYDHTLDQYHNNHVGSQTNASELAKFIEAGNQKMVDFCNKIAGMREAQEANFFQAGVQAAGGDATKFLTDVLKNFSDMVESPHFQRRLQEQGLNVDDLDLASAYKIPKVNLKLSVAQNLISGAAIAADYKEASRFIHQPGFNYLTEAQKNEYPHIYASAKLLQNASSGLDHEQAYASFREWAVKVDLQEQDWVKLDPTPVTQNNINRGFPASGLPNPLEELGRSI